MKFILFILLHLITVLLIYYSAIFLAKKTWDEENKIEEDIKND